MNSDRDGNRGGWATPGDDQSDAESAVEATGEFTIDYAPPAWYTQNAPGGGAGPAGSPPPAGSGAVPGLPAGSGFEPQQPPPPERPRQGPEGRGAEAGQAAEPGLPAAVPPAPVGGDGSPTDPGNGDLESGATMRFSAAALKREFQQ
ncbi:SCO5717 family growth-regulating ATPase, partial [Streptomyces sp. NPDC055058]